MWILNAKVIGVSDAPDVHEVVHLEFDESHHLQGIHDHLPASVSSSSINLAGDYLSLGGVDLQINGALGIPFPELDFTDGGRDALDRIGQFLWRQGVNVYSPTLVTTAVENFQRALHCLANYQPQSKSEPAADILGAHLEGPCLNPTKRGAHPEQFLQPLTSEVMDTVMGEYSEQVAIVTLAPELDKTGQTIAALKSSLPDSAVISLGHSLASDDEAASAFKQGASMVTHAFNAMPPLHHRQPGLLATALTTDKVWCGFIADGQHVSPRMLKLLIQSSPGEGLFLVSDALSPLGLPDGDYPWDERVITVTDGTARLTDGTLSGTTRPLLDGVINLVKWGCCQPAEAIALATDAPRRAMGLPRIQLGMALNQFLRWTYQPAHQQLTWERLG